MKSYIWALPLRLFHWLLAIGFAAAYILGEANEPKNLHFAFGALVGSLIIFRLIYGLLGPKFANFRDFPIGLKKQIEFARAFFVKTKVYEGHNPLASVVMLSIFIVGLLCSISGYLLYAGENNILSLNFGEDFLKEAHEITATIFLILVLFHLIGVALDFIFHPKNGTFLSIFTGYKNVETKKVKFNSTHKFFSVLWFVIPFFIFYLAYGLQVKDESSQNEIQQLEKTGQNGMSENDD